MTVEPLSRPWSRPVRAPLLWAGGVLAAAAVLHVRDPHVSGSYGFCPWNLLTGGYCPGCGGLRAVHDLTHLDVVGAASSNLLVVAAVPPAVLVWAAWTVARWRGERARPWPTARPALAVALVVVAAFTLLRNVPAGAWLAP